MAGRPLEMGRHAYLMLNKPRGVVCATHDDKLPTVLDLVPEELRRSGLFPAGRLDKDTEGFVLITDDGEFAHRILAPRSTCPKPIPRGWTGRRGRNLSRRSRRESSSTGGRACPLSSRPTRTTPGRRGWSCGRGCTTRSNGCSERTGITVTALRRDAIGGLALDPNLEPGKCRKLSKIEVERILTEGL